MKGLKGLYKGHFLLAFDPPLTGVHYVVGRPEPTYVKDHIRVCKTDYPISHLRFMAKVRSSDMEAITERLKKKYGKTAVLIRSENRQDILFIAELLQIPTVPTKVFYTIRDSCVFLTLYRSDQDEYFKDIHESLIRGNGDDPKAQLGEKILKKREKRIKYTNPDLSQAIAQAKR